MTSTHLMLQALLLCFLIFSSTITADIEPTASPMAFPLPPPPPASADNITLEYIDPSLPPLVSKQKPRCSTTVLQHNFEDTVGAPPTTVEYTPPLDCPMPWSRVVLELSAMATDVQKDRIAAIWVNRTEILRTSTPFSMAAGVHWQVHKDITRYNTLLGGNPDDGPTTLSMMLENSNATLPGVYTVNVTIHYYRGALCDDRDFDSSEKNSMLLDCNPLRARPSINGFYREPADQIIPILADNLDGSSGYWSKIENISDVRLSDVLIPKNTYRAVLEVYVSHHGDDEHWYANPLRSTTSDSADSKTNGGFRQIVVTIDKQFAGAVVPFPVMAPGSINPYFWAPVAGIGAYDRPSYDIDVTPFLGILLDERKHLFGIAIVDSQSYWLVSANLHLWLDPWSDEIVGALVQHRVPPLRLSRQASWRGFDGKSSIDGQVIIRLAGWLTSSKGNITTSVRYRLKFKSRVEVHMQGTIKQAEMELKARTDLKTAVNRGSVRRVQVSLEAPLQLEVMRSNGGGGSIFEKTKLVHQLDETTSVIENRAPAISTLSDRQEAEGSMLKDGDDGGVIFGSGDNKSTYKYRDDRSCYLRTLNVVGGKVQDDEDSVSCASLVDM